MLLETAALFAWAEAHVGDPAVGLPFDVDVTFAASSHDPQLQPVGGGPTG
jgi:hypothetical protein